MRHLSVLQIIGTPNAILHGFGMKVLHEVQMPLLDGDTPIILDFDGVQNATSGFFNALVGNLFQQLGEEKYAKVIRIEHLEDDIFEEKIQDAIALVKNPARAAAMESALADLFEA